MAEGILKSLDAGLEVHSAGTEPARMVHPHAITVMAELGIDLRSHHPKKADAFLEETWDYVITVCGGARESCPAFTGKVKQRLHIGFDDPAGASGSEEEVLGVFRRVRDEIRAGFTRFYRDHINPGM